jgi:dimethylargininase
LSTRFTRALVRAPGATYASGITNSTLGAPVLATALEQHARYVSALEACGLGVTALPADLTYPDGCFVEDTAIVTPTAGIVTRPGAATRAGETGAIAAALSRFFASLARIEAPGTVDGGDICQTDLGFLIGVSARTSEEGARQLAGLLGDLGFTSTVLDIRPCAGLLHLKTGMSYLGDGRMAVAPDLPALRGLDRYEHVVLSPAESYAANCVRINDRVLVPARHPRFADELARLGYQPLPLEMSEFQKMDGGLSCLSLRF